MQLKEKLATLVAIPNNAGMDSIPPRLPFHVQILELPNIHPCTNQAIGKMCRRMAIKNHPLEVWRSTAKNGLSLSNEWANGN